MEANRKADLERIYGQVWTSAEVCCNFEVLCRDFGGRFAGSSNEAAAGRFIADRLSTYGLSHTHRESFKITAWSRGDLSFSLVSPRRIPLPALALPYAPPCDGEWEVVDLGSGHPSMIERLRETIPGRAVMVLDENPPGTPTLHRLQKYLLAREAGAAVFIFVQNAPGMLPQTGSLALHSGTGADSCLPAIGIALETYEFLKLLGKSASLRIKLAMSNTLSAGHSANIVAELPGESGTADGFILVGAHYDGHDIAQGALDNASGTVVVMEAARVLTKLRRPLRRTIRFVLFGGEETGMLGSYHLAEKYQQEEQDIRFMVNADCVGRPGPLAAMLQVSPAFRDTIKAWADAIGDRIEVSDHLVPFSDHFPFLLKGIPSVFLATPGTGGRGWGHTAADTFDKVDCGTLRRHAGHLASLLVLLGDAESLPAGDIDHGVLVRELQNRHLLPLLTFEGHSISVPKGS